ncbi:MAG: MBOAT family protein [Clostridia bacterium]|nr:MBOAT family protein [Clostridia bacterium]
MLFNSGTFLLFFPIVTLAYFILPKKVRWVWLLVASFYFYMCWEPVYALLILASIAITYLSGLAIGHYAGNEEKPRRIGMQKLAVALSFILNLGILCFFKYFDFLAENLCNLLALTGIQLTRPKFSILLPVGISFYTFQALGYTMDVYRGKIDVERNFFRYALFVSFFPQLVAGPIERSGNLLRQLRTPTTVNYDRIRKGLMMMLWGYFLKMVISDRAAVIVNHVFGNFERYAGLTIVFATMMFAIQIYCDFGGYSAIAIGAAQVLGFELCQNFRQPYFATSVADFWHRWHISLSTWFRDYLYIPMGGSRRGKLRKWLNVLITFLVSGLWHGANWSYVLWGGLNGAMQVIGEWKDLLKNKGKAMLTSKGWKEPESTHSFSARLLKTLITFCLICLTWVFFRAESARQGFQILRQMFMSWNPWVLFDGTLLRIGLTQTQMLWLLVCIAVLFCVDILHEKGHHLRDELVRQQFWFRVLIYVLGLFSILMFAVYGPGMDASAFIYFQF